MKKLVFTLLSLIAFENGLLAQEWGVIKTTYDYLNNPTIEVKISNNTSNTIDYLQFTINYEDQENAHFSENDKFDSSRFQKVGITINLSPDYWNTYEVKGHTPISKKTYKLILDYVHFTNGSIKRFDEYDWIR